MGKGAGGGRECGGFAGRGERGVGSGPATTRSCRKQSQRGASQKQRKRDDRIGQNREVAGGSRDRAGEVGRGEKKKKGNDGGKVHDIRNGPVVDG